MDILIVENDTVVAKMWSRKLSNSGHSVRVAYSVHEAKLRITEKMPGLVLLDLRLNGPTNSGIDIYEFVRKELNENTPIIFITGLAYSVDLFQRAQHLVESDTTSGVITRMVEKPVRIHELSSLVNSIAA